MHRRGAQRSASVGGREAHCRRIPLTYEPYSRAMPLAPGLQVHTCNIPCKSKVLHVEIVARLLQLVCSCLTIGVYLQRLRHSALQCVSSVLAALAVLSYSPSVISTAWHKHVIWLVSYVISLSQASCLHTNTHQCSTPRPCGSRHTIQILVSSETNKTDGGLEVKLTVHVLCAL